MSQTFRALRIRNFRLYAAGALVSNLGTWMQRVAQDWLTLELTGSGTALGIVIGLQFVPVLLLAPYAGVVADRFPKRRVLLGTKLALAAAAAVLGVLAVTGVVEIWHVFVLALVFGATSAFDTPAQESFVAELVGPDELGNAVGLNGVSFHTARLLGPALAGLLIAWAGTGWVILTNAGCYFVLILALRLLRAGDLYTSRPAAREPRMIRAGLRYLRQRPDLVTVLSIVFAGGTFGFNFGVFAPLMATQVFGKGPEEFGLLGTMFGIGSVAAAFAAARRRRTRQRLVVGASVAFAVALIASGLMPTYLAYALAVPVTGYLAVIVLTGSNTLMQRGVPAELRGRLMALYAALLMGGTTVGAPMLGWIGQTFGPRWAPVTGGVLTMLGALASQVAGRRRAALPLAVDNASRTRA